MEGLWNMVSSIKMSLPTKAIEPGSMEYNNDNNNNNIFQRINLHLNGKSFREVMLDTCKEFNNGYFFLIFQLVLLVYCPSVALSIIYQTYELEQEQQPQDEEQFIQDSIFQQQCQFRQPYMKQEIKQKQMQLSQRSLIQLTQLLQRLMQKQQLFEQQYYQYESQQAVQAVIIRSTQPNNENGGVKVKIIVQIPSQERQVSDKMVIWQRFIITF